MSEPVCVFFAPDTYELQERHRRVGLDIVEGHEVSTVLLSSNWFPPKYETMLFPALNSALWEKHCNCADSYETREAAAEGHRRWVEAAGLGLCYGCEGGD